MQVRLKFLGGAKTVTGSRFLLSYDQKQILIDCGLFQGLKEYRLRNWDDFPTNPQQIGAVILTHAHLDHSGYLPKLVKEGFEGAIFCSKPTEDLIKIMLTDSAKLQEEEAEWAKKKGYSKHQNPKPLYDSQDAERVFPMLSGQKLDKWVRIDENLSFRLLYAGHILGAVIVQIKIKGNLQEKIITFSGDLGRYNNPMMFDPQSVKTTDVLVIESTYGNRVNEDEQLYNTFSRKVKQALNRGGVLIIPSFAVGRAQSILHFLCQMKAKRELNGVKVYLDSPMAIDVTQLYADHASYHKLDTKENALLFNFDGLKYVDKVSTSKELNEIKSEAIIISASGMVTGGRILHHLFHRLSHKQNTLLFVGYQGEGTRGRKILEGADEVRIFGESVRINCHVDYIAGFSAHADQQELVNWTDSLLSQPKMTFLVHGEEEAMTALKNKLEENGNQNVIIPEYLETFELFDGL